LGSTGLIGTELVKQLVNLNQIEKIYLPVRNKKGYDNPKVQEEIVDYKNISSNETLFNVDIVYCTLGTTIRKAGSQEKFREVDFTYVVDSSKAAQKFGVKKFLLVTALGADKNSSIFYNKVKGETETEVINLGLPFLGIFRPSLLLGDRKEFRPGEKIAEFATGVFSFAFFGGLKKYKPIQASSVARAMILLSFSNSKGLQILESNKIEELSSST